MAIIYLIHFQEPIGDLSNPRGWAQHYLGSCKKLSDRLERHASGNGARLMQVVKERGTGWILVRTWHGPRSLERQLKRRHKNPRLCPLCNPNARHFLHRSAKEILQEIGNGNYQDR
jgi:hypothetical protein